MLAMGEKEAERFARVSQLVACEEAGPCTRRQHAQMPPRADHPFARLRPAPVGRCKQSICHARMHKTPRWHENSTFSLAMYSGKLNAGVGAISGQETTPLEDRR